MPEALRTVGRYEILHDIGRGGMARVYLARQIDLDRFVALKELHKVLHDDDPSYAQRFLRESRLAGKFTHPNIVTVFDYFEHDGVPYIAMEYVNGSSLRPYVGQLTLAQIAGVLEGLLAGLAHAEEHGVVHRDLKPENLMVTSDGRVKIADFGIAKAKAQMETGAFRTQTGTTVGTPTYMAPEQAMAGEIGSWTDLYSVGCITFELFTGKPPFHDSPEPMAILLRHINEPLPPVSSLVEDIDPRLSAWTAQLLLKDPVQRPRSSVTAWEELEEIVIEILGPRWRRDARLRRGPESETGARPLTPAPFEDADGQADVGDSDGFESFSWGEPSPGAADEEVSEDPEEASSAVPGPYTPPPPDLPVAADYETYDVPPPARPPTRTEELESLIAQQASAEPAEPESPPRPPPEPPPVTPAPPPVEPAPPPPREHSAPADEATLAPTPAPQPDDAAARPAQRPRRDRRSRPSRRLVLICAGVAGCAALAALGYAVAPTSVAETGLDQKIESSQLGFRVPVDWSASTLDAGDDIGRLPLEGEVVGRAPGAPPEEAVLAGTSRTTDPSLLPDSFVAAVTNARVQPTAVRVAGGKAYRYGDLRLRGSNLPLTVFALPTTKGVATLACRGASGSAAARYCDAIAQTLTVRDGEVVDPPPRPPYARAINDAVGSLTAAEQRADSILRQARRPRAIAGAADELARAYGTAAGAVEKIDTAPFEAEPTKAIAGRLRTLNRTYRGLATAARKERRRKYGEARSRASRERADLVKRLQALRDLGYDTAKEKD